jgi:hypothetical protein
VDWRCAARIKGTFCSLKSWTGTPMGRWISVTIRTSSLRKRNKMKSGRQCFVDGQCFGLRDTSEAPLANRKK